MTDILLVLARHAGHVLSRTQLLEETQGIAYEGYERSIDQHINGFQGNRIHAIMQAVTGNVDIPGGWVSIPFIRLGDMRMTEISDPIGTKEHPLFRRFWGRTGYMGAPARSTTVTVVLRMEAAMSVSLSFWRSGVSRSFLSGFPMSMA